MEQEIVHFLHIGKTGGTALRVTLKRNKSKKYIFKFHNHPITLKELPEGEKVIFLVRDPLTKFVSGFYSRQRKGRPRSKSVWKKGEKEAFKEFKTANKLAETLSSKNQELKKKAINAMKNIMHVKSHYWDWLIDEKYFKKRSKDIFFIGHQEKLNQDFEKLKKLLSLSKKAKLPTNKVSMHKNPDRCNYYLSPLAKKNLKKWYSEDYNFLKIIKV